MLETHLTHAMERCIELGQIAIQRGNYGLGALVMDASGLVLAESGSTLLESYDPSAHPEMSVIRAAAQLLKTSKLPGLYLVSTLEPCVMCTGVALQAEMSGIAFGATQKDAIKFGQRQDSRYHRWRQIRMKARKVIKAAEGPRPVLYKGLLREECQQLFVPIPRRNS